ncbi:L,D-transpeptidase family protein, partial [Olegusella massiliensis]|uniref:L,D-transpeptidase family protein n=1 Tax=Olegusella massiliensis TaxID=1776381 RepID=UPI0023F75CD2
WTQNIDGNTYYFDGSYKMYKGLLRWAATKDYSYFGNDGAMVVGRFVTPATNRIYYFNDAGRSLRWTQVIGDHTYYFGSSYLMHTGWLRWNADKTFSYFEDNPSSNLYGVLYTGAHTIDGISYNFGDEGKVQNAACWVVSDNSYTYYYKNGNSGTFHKSAYTTWKRIQHMKSGTQYFGAVDIDNTQTTFYQRTDNVWEPIKSWACSVGNERFGTGTPRGVWHVTTNKKVYAVAAGTEETPYTCYYWTVFTNDYRSFHSIPCYPGTKRYARGSQGRLRRHISSGCVRLKLENAYWIYRIIKKGTTVYIF